MINIEKSIYNDSLSKNKWYYILVALCGSLFGLFACIIAELPLKWFIVFLLGLSSLTGFMLLKDKRKVALAAFVFFLPIFATKKIFYSDYLLNPGGPASLGIFLYDLPLIYLAGQFIWERVYKKNYSLYIPILFWPFTLFTIWSGISIINAGEPVMVIVEFLWQVKIGLMLFLLCNIVKNRKDLELVFIALFASLLFQEIITLIQAYLKIWFTFTGDVERTMLESTSAPQTFRAGGTVGVHNVQAGYYSMIIPVAAGFIFCIKNKKYQYALIMIVLMGLLTTLLTYSRNGYLCLFITLTFIGYLAFKKKFITVKHIIISIWLMISSAVILFPFYGNTIIERIKSKEAVTLRFETIDISLNMIKEHPFIGIGLNNFSMAMMQKEFSPLGISPLQKTYMGGQLFGIVVHNKYLLIASQIGIIGLFFYLILIFVTFRYAFNLQKNRDPFYSSIGIGLAAGLLGASINMLSDIFNSELLISIFWVLIVLVFITDKIAGEEGEKRI